MTRWGQSDTFQFFTATFAIKTTLDVKQELGLVADGHGVTRIRGRLFEHGFQVNVALFQELLEGELGPRHHLFTRVGGGHRHKLGKSNVQDRCRHVLF